jgi:hypothetical protein
VARAADRLPRRGSAGPWRSTNSYPRDLLVLRWGRIADRHLRFAPARVPSRRESHIQGESCRERGFHDTTRGRV